MSHFVSKLTPLTFYVPLCFKSASFSIFLQSSSPVLFCLFHLLLLLFDVAILLFLLHVCHNLFLFFILPRYCFIFRSYSIHQKLLLCFNTFYFIAIQPWVYCSSQSSCLFVSLICLRSFLPTLCFGFYLSLFFVIHQAFTCFELKYTFFSSIWISVLYFCVCFSFYFYHFFISPIFIDEISGKLKTWMMVVTKKWLLYPFPFLIAKFRFKRVSM